MSTLNNHFVTININDFINACSDYPSMSFDHLREFKTSYRDRQLNILGHNFYKEDCVDNVCLREIKNGTEPVFSLDSSDFTNSVVKYYGLDGNISIHDQLKEKLSILESIKSIEELKSAFPFIASCYTDGLFSFCNCSDSSVITYLYNCGIRTNFSYMISEQIVLLKDLIARYETMLYNHSHFQFDLFDLRGIDTDKAKLYVTYQCLKNYSDSSQAYLIDYFENVFSFSNSKFIIADGKVVSSNLLYRMYRDRFKKNSLNYKINLESNRDRKEFYENSGYVKRVDGLFSSQYTGFFYGNGKVVCDVVSGLDGAKHSNSILIFDISRLKRLCSLSLNFVRYDKDVRVVSHLSNWKDVINASIRRDVSKKDKDKVMQLLKGVEKYGRRQSPTVM